MTSGDKRHMSDSDIDVLIQFLKDNQVSLKDYIDIRIKGLDEKLNSQAAFNLQHFTLNEMAIKKAEESMLQRLESMNEFRAQIKDERGSLATKDALESVRDSTDTRLKLLERSSENLVTKEYLNTVTEKRIKTLETANAFSAGKLWMVMAAFAVIPTIIALVALFKK